MRLSTCDSVAVVAVVYSFVTTVFCSFHIFSVFSSRIYVSSGAWGWPHQLRMVLSDFSQQQQQHERLRASVLSSK